MRKDKSEKGEISRRDFLIGAGSVVVGGAIGAGITYPLVAGKEKVTTKTVETVKTVTVPTTVTTTVGAETVTETTTVGAETVTSTVPGTTVTTTVTGTVTPEEPEESFVKGLGLCGLGIMGSNSARIDVKGGKVVRIRPLNFDEKYDPEEFNPGGVWKIEARGKVFEPTMKSLLPPHSLGYKKRVYSPNRIKYPLKRVDWDPNGDRNPQNRGKSKFKKISWDEAATIIAGEITRIHDTYGPYGICALGSGHGESKNVHAAHGAQIILLNLLGGYTKVVRNPDSWEGWFWGAKHVWGMDAMMGQMNPVTNCFNDASENTEMILWWGCDAETTPWGWSGQMASRLCYWFTEVGIKSVYVCPDLNYAAAVHADKWIPVLPNTDAALHLAISYIWISEGTYDKDYVATHTYGFEEYEKYVMGDEDGIPKTPEWASAKCGVPEWTIKALARAWASKATSTAHGNGGGYIRGPYSTEPGRLEPLNLAMQGIGKPGRHQMSMIEWGMFGPGTSPLPGGKMHIDMGAVFRSGWMMGIPKQHFPQDMFHKCILNPPQSWYATTDAFVPVEDQFVQYTYPIAEEDGGTEVHMYWTDSPCNIGCWQGGNEYIKAYRSPKIEFILAQHPWLENDCLYADIILPVNTKIEEKDIGVDVVSGQFDTYFLEEKCIEPVGESKTDYEAVGEIAKKLGLYDDYTEGKTVDEWVRFGFDTSGLQDVMSWEEFKEKGYFVVPVDPDWKTYPVGLANFVADPEGNPLHTKSGKIEFYAQWLSEHFPDDKERPPVPHWIEGGPGVEWYHDESLWGERCKDYPLLLVTNHPRWRVHANLDDVPWLREIPTCKVKGPDGYLYEPVWINPTDAAARGIESGDIVKMYNERGAVLGGAYVTERIRSGAVYQDHAARLDEIIPGQLDRGGSNNAIAPKNTTSKNATGEVTNSFLVEVEKVSGDQMEEWRKQYPEAFTRGYDPDYGPLFNGWVEGGM